MSEPSGTGSEFLITRAFDAPAERVFAAWTEPDRLMRWWGPKGAAMRACTIDPRPGGVFHYGMEMPDGAMIWGKWVFREVVRPERLVAVASFSDEAGGVTRHSMAPVWPLRLLSTFVFTETAGRTTVTIRWCPLDAVPAERQAFDAAHPSMQQGWTGTLDRLTDHLAAGSG